MEKDLDESSIEYSEFLVERAREIALREHGDQRYGDQPYSVHLQEVVGVLKEWGHECNYELMAAAWLHDTLEDTMLMRGSLVDAGFSTYTIALIDAVTNQTGKNRKERHALTYPRIKRIPEAVTLKLADRVANVRHCLKDKKKSLLQMYANEWQEFYHALRGTDPFSNVREWTVLIDLLGDPAGERVEHNFMKSLREESAQSIAQ